MNLQPTIFISSIISEFYDLRGALKYFLGNSGFRVLMSEEPDFGADCDKDSLDNCKSGIENSDYYFLIIGLKPGFIFQLEDKNDTSVTYEEFKHFLELTKNKKKINLIAFVRKNAWALYEKNDFEKMHPIQHKFIDDLVHNSILDKKIGRWRYTFDKFNDIITVLETNQNGLFLEATRKNGIYREYLKRDFTQILKMLVIKDSVSAKIKTLKQFLDLPELKFSDFMTKEKISKKVAIRIITFIQFYSYKDELLLRINRVFNYIAQGEFSFFDTEKEKYELPEYIKSAIQALEILETSLIKFKSVDKYEEIAKRDTDDFWISEFEYGFVTGQLTDLNISTINIINLLRFFYNNWSDFKKSSIDLYEYRSGATLNSVSTKEVIHFSNEFFEKK